MDALEIAESLTRDQALLSLPQIALHNKLALLALKYGFRAAKGLGLRTPTRFKFNGRIFHGDSYADPGFLILNLVEMCHALDTLGMLGRSGLSLVDVGAHHGETALAWHILCDRPNVISFEPNPVCYRKALQNTRGLSVRVVNIGLGNERGTLPFDAGDPVSMRRTFDFGPPKLDRVPLSLAAVGRGDDLIDFNVVDLVKIDVEGYEYPALLGLRKTLTRCSALILELSLERQRVHRFREIAAFLADYPFELVSAGTLWREDSRFSCIDLYFKREDGAEAAATVEASADVAEGPA